MLVSYSLVFLYALLPFQLALNPAPGFDVASVRVLIPLVALFWLIKGLKNRHLYISTASCTWFLLAFLFMAVFSLLLGQNIIWGLRKVLFLLTLFPVYFVLVDVLRDAKQRTFLLSALIWGASILSILGIIQFVLQFILGIADAQAFWASHIIGIFLGNSFAETVLKYPSWLVHIGGKDYFRTIATFPDPHMLAFFLNMVLPFALLNSFYAKEKRWFSIAATFLILAASILTFSRGGYLGLILSLFLGSVFFLKKSHLFRNKKTIFFAFLILATFFFMTANPVRNRLFSSLDTSDGSNRGRMVIWKETLQLIAENPQGVGIGNYPLAVVPTAAYRDPIYAHNIYLDIAAEMGLLGLFFWLSLISAAAYRFWRGLSAEPFRLAGLMSIVAFAVHGLVENPLFSIHVFTLFMLILALSSQHFHETD